MATNRAIVVDFISICVMGSWKQQLYNNFTDSYVDNVYFERFNITDMYLMK